MKWREKVRWIFYPGEGLTPMKILGRPATRIPTQRRAAK